MIGNVPLLGCVVEKANDKVIQLYVENRICGSGFYVCFSVQKKGVTLVWSHGALVDLQRFRDARWVARQVLMNVAP